MAARIISDCGRDPIRNAAKVSNRPLFGQLSRLLPTGRVTATGSRMAEQERGFAPTDPYDDEDLLAPEPKPERRTSDEEATDLQTESEAAESEEEAAQARAARREFVRLGWATLLVFAVIGVLIVVELVRISSAVNNTGCFEKAQAQFLQNLGPGVKAPYAGLGRLTALNQLKKCI